MTLMFRPRVRIHILAVAALVIGSLALLSVPDIVKIAALAIASLVILVGGPSTALFVSIATIPLSTQSVAIGSTIWTPLELSLVVCGLVVGCWAAAELFRSTSLTSVRQWLPLPDVQVLAVTILIVGVLSIWWVAEPDLRADSLRALRRVIIEPLFIVPVAVYAARTRNGRDVSIWIGVPALIVSLLALGQLVSGTSTVDIGGFARPIGTFTHPNNLAFYLERTIWFVPVAAMVFRVDRRLVWLLTAIVLAASLASLSRGSAIALAAGGLVFGWSEIRQRIRLVAGLALAGAGAVFASRYFAESGESVGSRVDIWRSSVNMIQDHPFTGVGLDQFLGQYGTRYVLPQGWAERYTSHPHNLILDFWLSLGIAGLLVLWLLCEAIWTRLRLAMTEPDWTIQRAAVAMLVAGLMHGIVDNSFFLAELATLTWLGLVLATSKNDEALRE